MIVHTKRKPKPVLQSYGATPPLPPEICLSVTVLCWNKWHLTWLCLRSLLEDVPDAEVLVVDNGSTDETPELLRGFPVRVLTLPANVGVTKGFNTGLQALTGNVLCMLNNDTIVQPGGMRALAEAAWRTGIASYAGGKLDLRCEFAGYTEKAEESDYPDGAALTARRDVWEAVGWLDEAYSPGLCEDSDWGMRARSLGFSWEIVPRAILHIGHQSGGADPTMAAVRQRNIDLLRSRWQADKHRRHYASDCYGDTARLLDPQSYEYPRVRWLLDRAEGPVLDVGCGTGDVCGCLARRMPCTGIDPGRRHIETACERHPNVAFMQCMADEFAKRYSTRYFATVLCGDVIEHVPDDRAFLECLRRLGVRVYLTTPNGEWPSHEHLRVYSPETAQVLVAPYGGTVDVIPDREGKPRWLGLTVPGECIDRHQGEGKSKGQ